MANNVKNVAAGRPLATGGILVGGDTFAPPTDATGELVGANAIGYIGEDGLTRTIDRVTEKIRAWGGDTVKVVQTEHGVTYSFVMIEIMNAEVLKAYYGDANVTTTAPTVSSGTLHSVLVNGDPIPDKPYVFEVKDGKAKIRQYVPIGAVTEQGETVYADADVIAYPMTIEALPDASGNKVYEYLDDGVFSAA